MVGTAVMISPQWRESDSLSVLRQTELIESMAGRRRLKEALGQAGIRGSLLGAGGEATQLGGHRVPDVMH